MITIIQATTEEQIEQVRILTRSYVAWQRDTYFEYLDLIDKYFDPKQFEAGLAALPGEYGPPAGCLLLAYYGDAPAGTAALQDLGDQICEMKSMFVDRQFQGKSLGRALGKALIEEARAIGYNKMRLETGPRQFAAHALYRSLGFQEIEPYHYIPQEFRGFGLLFMELIL